MVWSHRPMFGLPVPFEHTERCRESTKRELENQPEGACKVARDRDRIHRARDVRIEDLDQRLGS